MATLPYHLSGTAWQPLWLMGVKVLSQPLMGGMYRKTGGTGVIAMEGTTSLPPQGIKTVTFGFESLSYSRPSVSGGHIVWVDPAQVCGGD